MSRFAIVDGNNGIVGFSPIQTTYMPAKRTIANPAPWRSLSCPVADIPAFDPATQAIVGPSYTVSVSDVTESYSVRQLSAAEIKANKDAAISSTDTVLFKIAFNHENRIRVLEGKPTITVAQFITGVEALL